MHKLFLEATAETLDWGTLDCYTCSGSCNAVDTSDQYLDEFVFLQPPLVFACKPRAPVNDDETTTAETETTDETTAAAVVSEESSAPKA
jgi:hypothetical protein